MTKKYLKIAMLYFLTLCILGIAVYMVHLNQERKDFDTYMENTNEYFSLFAENVEALNSGRNVDFEDFTKCYISFSVASSNWNKLYYHLKEKGHLPNSKETLSYSLGDVLLEIKMLYFDTVEVYFLNDSKKDSAYDQENILIELESVRNKLASFTQFDQ